MVNNKGYDTSVKQFANLLRNRLRKVVEKKHHGTLNSAPDKYIIASYYVHPEKMGSRIVDAELLAPLIIDNIFGEDDFLDRVAPTLLTLSDSEWNDLVAAKDCWRAQLILKWAGR